LENTARLGRRAAAIIVMGLLVYPSAQARAFTRESAIFPLGIRSAGMGETGTADHMEIANTAFNPALVSMMNNGQAFWSHSELPIGETIEIKLDGGGVGVGYQWRVGESYTVGGGLVFSYAKERWNSTYHPDPNDDTMELWFYEQGYALGTAASVGYRDVLRFGVGINTKWARNENNPDDESGRMVSEATIFDAGFDLIIKLVDKAGYKLSAAAGFAYFNFGGEVKHEGRQVFLPEGTALSSDPAEYRRYGLNTTFNSPSWAKSDRIFDASLPVLSAAVNYDKLDFVSEYNYGYGNRYMVGGEVAFMKILSLRAGTIRWKMTGFQGEIKYSNPTYGIGIAIPYRRYYLRFDYARRNIDAYDEKQNQYGLVFDAAF
jgi:hypothetical protein